MSFENLEQKLDEARDGSGTDSTSSGEYETYPRVKMAPEVAIGGTIVDVGFSGNPYADQNVRGADWEDSGDFVFVLEDPEVVRGQLYEALGRTDAEDNTMRTLDPSWYPFDVGRNGGKATRGFRVVDDDVEDCSHISDMAKKVDGDYEQVGIEVYGSEYPAQPRDSFDGCLEQYDRVEVYIGSQAGRMIAQSLDCEQGNAAYIREGEKTTGLMEFPRDRDESDDYPRVAAIDGPLLHSELEGEDVALFLHFGDMDLTSEGEDDDADDDGGDAANYRKHFGDVLWSREDDAPIISQNDSVLDPEDGRREPTDMYLHWHEPASGWSDTESTTSNGSGGSATTDDSGGSSGGSTFDFEELDQGGVDDGLVTVSDLDPDTRQFVEEAAEYVSDGDTIDESFSDFDEMVTQAIEGEEIDPEVDVATVREALEGEI